MYKRQDADEIFEENCPLGDRSNMIYSSSIITYGRAEGVVVSTGMDTEVGNIASLIEDQDELEMCIRDRNSMIAMTTVTGYPQALYGRFRSGNFFLYTTTAALSLIHIYIFCCIA